jgi:uncharacterized protein (TIGR03067 family)
MMKNLLTLVLAASVTTVALAQTQTAKPATAAPKVQALMQGTWVLITANGQDLAAAGAPEITVTITGDKYVQTTGGEVVERGSFKIDETKKPMTMDMIITEGDSAGKTQVGVIEVTETTMRGNLNEAGESVRPKDFTPVDGYFAFTAKKK